MQQNFLDSILKQFRYYERLGRQTMAQLDDAGIRYEPAPGVNSIAVIVKHLHGNMLSRWTDFLTSDGEKPWRAREGEFDTPPQTKADTLALWEAGWACLFSALESLAAEDVVRIVYIRNEGHTVLEAIHRQLCHYSYHVGQIAYLGKVIQGDQWKSLSIPRGGTAAYNQQKFSQEKTRRHFTDEG